MTECFSCKGYISDKDYPKLCGECSDREESKTKGLAKEGLDKLHEALGEDTLILINDDDDETQVWYSVITDVIVDMDAIKLEGDFIFSGAHAEGNYVNVSFRYESNASSK